MSRACDEHAHRDFQAASAPPAVRDAPQDGTEDRKIQVSVGSGFNDDHRRTITTDVIGKVVAVKYNARITNKQGEESLFLPIFVEIRDDKDVADSSGDIK